MEREEGVELKTEITRMREQNNNIRNLVFRWCQIEAEFPIIAAKTINGDDRLGFMVWGLRLIRRFGVYGLGCLGPNGCKVHV